MFKSLNLDRIKLFFVCLCLIFSSQAFADENVISSVIISNSKDNQNAFELNIDSTQVVPYKVTLENDNSIYFDLKNSTLSDDIGTYYDDVTNIDNVVVKQLDKNKVRIYVEGQNAKNTELIFPNSIFEPKENSKKIVLNRPINEYRPTNVDYDLENQDDIQDWDDNSFNFSHLTVSLLSHLKDGAMGIVLIVLSIFTIIMVAIKNISQKLSSDNEPLINPSALYSESIPKREESLERSETLRNAQEQLSRAHQKYQTYLQNKYQNNVKRQAVSPVTRSIALNQYQRSSENPYKNQEVIRIKREFMDNNQQENTIIPRRPKTSQEINFSSPYIQKKVDSPIVQEDKSKTNLKFLESVTKIYEQSGRKDLADGLKNSITKVKQNI